MLKSYRTIQNEGTHEIEIKKSRFIAHLKRTQTEDEAIAFIEQVKEQHKDATHNCSAYQIGEKNEIQRARDDGEPSGTAGVPMLEIFRKRDLKYVTAVVTRYFGGKKLGAGGLIRAYGGVVNDAVDALGVVERRLQQEIRLTVDYTLSGKLENELQNSKYHVEDIEYTDKVTFVCFADSDKVEEFRELTTGWLSAQGEYERGEERYIEIPQSE